MSTAGPLRQPIPTAHSILWSPASAGKPPGHIPFPVFLSQAALTAIREHLAAPRGPGQGMLGFLLGDQCESPDTNLSYLVVDVALRLNQPIYGDRTRDVVTRIWDHIQLQLEEQRASLIGWYHSHPPLPLTLSTHDVETHEHYFAEPWQVALLLGTDAAEPTGAFFRASSDEDWVTTPLPFYELLNPESIRPDGKRRSFVIWKNYRAYGIGGAPPPAISSPHPAVRPPAEPKFTPAAPAAPAASPPPPPRAPRPPQPAADTSELVFLTAAEDQPPPAPPAPPPRPRPPARPVPPVAQRTSRAPEPEPEPEPEPTTEPVGASADEALSWPEEVADELVPPAPPVAPERRPSGATRRGPRRRSAWRRRAKAVLWLVVIALLGVGTYKWVLPQLATVRWSAVAGTWSSRAADAWSALRGKAAALVKTVRGAVAPSSPAAGARTPKPVPRPSTAASNPPARAGSAGGTAVPVTPPALVRLSRTADSLSKAVRLFGERARLFDGRQLPCADLARELAAVENRWTAYNVAKRGAGVLDAPYAARDQSLYAGVDSVERRYERSGCQRP